MAWCRSSLRGAGFWRVLSRQPGQKSAARLGCSPFSSAGGPAFDWLSERNVTGATAKRVIAELGRAGLPQAQMPGLLESMGEAGLKQLVDSVERVRAGRPDESSAVVEITVEVPKERHSFVLRGRVGESLFDIVTDADAESGGEQLAAYLECACGGVSACSTCHVRLERSVFEALPEPSESEMDMLDLAFGFEEAASRLGCQLKITEDFNGAKIQLPEGVHNYF